MWKELIQQYVQWLESAGKASATVVAYQKDIEQFSQYLLQGGKADPKQVVAEDVERYKTELQTLRYSDKSVARKINSLKSFFRYLMDSNVLSDNPVKTVPQPKYEVSTPHILSKVEYRALRDVVKHDVRMSSIVELLLQTGLRISELAALRLDDIALPKREVFIAPHGSQSSRVVPLNDAAINAIEQYSKVRPRSKERIFFLTKSCRPFLVRNIRSTLDRYFRMAGVHGAKVNDLRHTFIVEQLSAGVPLITVSKIVGHKRISTTERYLEFVDPAQLTAQVELREL